MASFEGRLRAAFTPRYEFRRELGSGGSASVWEALDRTLDCAVAIKVLRPEQATAVAAERFLREVRTLARLRHPNIVRLHDAGEKDGLLYYVMDLVEAPTLKDRLAERALTREEAVDLGSDLLAALEAVHGAELVHRDVKPSNLFLTADRALLADFGIATSADTTSSEGLTEDGRFVGTRHYAPPEQVIPGGKVTARSDLYSTGLVLYEALTRGEWSDGRPPSDWSGVPDDLKRILARALDPDPAKRWPDARAFRDGLAGRRPEPDRARVVWNRESRGSRWRGTSVLLLAGVAVILGILLPRRPPPPPGGIAESDACGRSDDPRVVELYREGLRAWGFRPDSLSKATDLFVQATLRDPTFACAQAGLANVLIARPGRGFGLTGSREAFEEARGAAERALAIDSDLAAAHAALAEVKSSFEWDWEGAEAEYRIAIGLDSTYGDAHLWYAHHLAAVGHADRAIEEARIAESLAPGRPTASAGVGAVLYHAGRFEEAQAQLTKTLELSPEFAEARLWLIGALIAGGRRTEAGLMLDRLAEALGPPGSPPLAYQAILAGGYAALGRENEARRRLAPALTPGDAYVSPFWIGVAYTQLRDADSAMRWLDSAYVARDEFLRFLRVAPTLDPVRSDPRFEALLGRMSFPELP